MDWKAALRFLGVVSLGKVSTTLPGAVLFRRLVGENLKVSDIRMWAERAEDPKI